MVGKLWKRTLQLELIVSNETTFPETPLLKKIRAVVRWAEVQWSCSELDEMSVGQMENQLL